MKQSKNLGWFKLDNAAKIFPPNSTQKDTKVFRFACTLTECVEREILQRAVDKTLEEFPMYQSIIRKGLFWYYFEKSNLRPVVREEYRGPCAALYNGNEKSLLFEVTYYKKRINLEVYHALTDGTGALQFLKTVIRVYFKLKEGIQATEEDLEFMDEASVAERQDDSFDKYYDTNKVKARKGHEKAYHMRGEKHSEDRLQVITSILSTKALLQASKAYSCTMSVFLCSVLIAAIAQQMTKKERRKKISISIPVNLRNYFESASARNFFTVVRIAYLATDEVVTLENIIPLVAEQFRRELLTENFQERLNNMVSLEHNYITRVMPLSIKKHTLKVAHRLTNREITSVLSNVGSITMPEQLQPYIDHFEVYVSTEKIQVGLCSYQDKLAISFTSPFVDTEVQKNFFRTLTAMGIEVTVATNIK